MSDTVRGALWMIGSVISFTCMAVAGREASVSLDTFEIMMYRSLIGLIIVVIILTATRRWHVVRRDHLGLHVVRNITHFIGQNLWFYALAVIPLAQVFALEFTTPLWVIVLAPLVVGDRMTTRRALCGLIGFIGILIVARPSPDTINAGVITASAAAIFFALTYLFTSRLTRHETTGGIMFWLTAIQLVLGLSTAGYDGNIALPDAGAWPHVVVIALAGLVAHFCITNAVTIAPAAVVAPVDFARLPTIAIVGMILYAEPVDIWIFVGALIIFGANYVNILTESRKNRVA